MSRQVTGSGRIALGTGTVDVEFTVPEGPCGPEALLPGARRLANRVAALGEAGAQRDGLAVSCRAGCGACCRQLVPVSPAEARALVALVDAMPPERARAIRQRFADARARLAAAGLARPVSTPGSAERPSLRAFGLDYFRLGVACPFLEDESCSIHPDRPLVCREYLVTSDPAECARPEAGRVRPVPVPVHVWSAFARSQSPTGTTDWMPLIEALEFSERPPAPPAGSGDVIPIAGATMEDGSAAAGTEPAVRTGTSRVAAFLREVSGRAGDGARGG